MKHCISGIKNFLVLREERMLSEKNASKMIVNITTILVLVVSAVVLISSFFNVPALSHRLYGNSVFNHFVQRLTAVALLIVAWNLYRRKQIAWLMTVALLIINLFSRLIMHRHSLSTFLIVRFLSMHFYGYYGSIFRHVCGLGL